MACLKGSVSSILHLMALVLDSRFDSCPIGTLAALRRRLTLLPLIVSVCLKVFQLAVRQ